MWIAFTVVSIIKMLNDIGDTLFTWLNTNLTAAWILLLQVWSLFLLQADYLTNYLKSENCVLSCYFSCALTTVLASLTLFVYSLLITLLFVCGSFLFYFCFPLITWRLFSLRDNCRSLLLTPVLLGLLQGWLELFRFV